MNVIVLSCNIQIFQMNNKVLGPSCSSFYSFSVCNKQGRGGRVCWIRVFTLNPAHRVSKSLLGVCYSLSQLLTEGFSEVAGTGTGRLIVLSLCLAVSVFAQRLHSCCFILCMRAELKAIFDLAESFTLSTHASRTMSCRHQLTCLSLPAATVQTFLWLPIQAYVWMTQSQCCSSHILCITVTRAPRSKICKSDDLQIPKN